MRDDALTLMSAIGLGAAIACGGGDGGSGPSTMAPGGQMTPRQTGSITIRVTIDGQVWELSATAYDWLPPG